MGCRLLRRRAAYAGQVDHSRHAQRTRLATSTSPQLHPAESASSLSPAVRSLLQDDLQMMVAEGVRGKKELQNRWLVSHRQSGPAARCPPTLRPTIRGLLL